MWRERTGLDTKGQFGVIYYNERELRPYIGLVTLDCCVGQERLYKNNSLQVIRL